MALRRGNSNPGRIVRASFSFTHPRAVILTNPAVVVAAGVFVLALVFTIWPLALEHSPIGFERRGVIHHIWHYTLLGGSLLSLYGMFSVSARRLQYEFIGLLFLANALALNLVVQVAVFAEEGLESRNEGVTGVGLILRIVVICILLLRMYVLYYEPKVDVAVTTAAETAGDRHHE